MQSNENCIFVYWISICACRNTSMYAFHISGWFTFDKAAVFYKKSVSDTFMYWSKN